ncbi:methylated-DNA-[protein]-cysteine S-methyltransferase [Caloramator quimbayensis]|uniref:Methylated-DNA--protein-cysteine methyltransferase n=1 Tax=Caloramator quimbayensis TaxID=1147123 RepID=A0A1T4Y5U3_9CLOT|nr:methylated-DNA--[protein]-cysteine S-methyltransferase [Caloramator quimbayensis]SKA96681.1 methylated-DNA-[protein]-cysteine S-methyltransferase [Caloramator quimbayensis]
MEIYRAYYMSKIGMLEILGNEDGISAINFVNGKLQPTKASEIHPSLIDCIDQLQRYFEGSLKEFNVKLNIAGTEFQKKVWNELMKIPYGKTVSYLYIAKSIGNEKAVRAVGGANNKNKIPIIIPCHRVIGNNGKLIGYAGGLGIKEWLLKHEGALKHNY